MTDVELRDRLRKDLQRVEADEADHRMRAERAHRSIEALHKLLAKVEARIAPTE